MLDIGYVTVLYFLIGLLAAKAFDAFYGKFDSDKYEKEGMWTLLGDILLHLFAIGVVAYILRNIVGAIPSPFHGVAGFDHERLKELEGGFVLDTVLILFQIHLMEKIAYFAKKFMGIVGVKML